MSYSVGTLEINSNITAGKVFIGVSITPVAPILFLFTLLTLHSCNYNIISSSKLFYN